MVATTTEYIGFQSGEAGHFHISNFSTHIGGVLILLWASNSSSPAGQQTIIIVHMAMEAGITTSRSALSSVGLMELRIQAVIAPPTSSVAGGNLVRPAGRKRG